MGFFVRGEDGNVVGPVRYDQLVRGVAVQKIPLGTMVRREDGDAWEPVEHVVGLAAPAPKPPNGEAKKESEPRGSTERSYEDLRTVSTNLKTQATVLKVIGPVLFLGTVLLTAKLIDRWGSDSMLAWVVVSLGAITWIALYSMGTLIGAGGDLLGALRDIARNTSRIP
jgi:hypothetical protein